MTTRLRARAHGSAVRDLGTPTLRSRGSWLVLLALSGCAKVSGLDDLRIVTHDAGGANTGTQPAAGNSTATQGGQSSAGGVAGTSTGNGGTNDTIGGATSVTSAAGGPAQTGGAGASSSNLGGSTPLPTGGSDSGGFGFGGTLTQSGGASTIFNSLAGGALATGGNVGVGGNLATGGNPNVGGKANTGGVMSTSAGTSTTGGNLNTGGDPGIGGNANTGGAVNTGGKPPTGGVAATGGAPTGGNPATGGTTAAATGGALATGGTGGAAISGGAATDGGAATGGATSVDASSCTWSSAPSSSNGQLTCYWFSQGTPNDISECPSMYKTYCGYCGTETGQRDQSSPYPCAIGQIQDTLQHMSTPHFAAFPQSYLEQGKYCGMCVEVTYMQKTIVATIVDACGSCSSAGHLDLSLSAAEALGMTEWNGSPDTGVSWKTVPCPVTEDIYVRYNGGVGSQPYFQNTAFPVTSAKVGSQSAQLNTGFWMFQGDVSGQVVTLTDTMGHTIQGTMPTASTGGSLGVQFPLTCE